MPVVATFYGIIIRIYHDDHAPPHFHAQYGNSKVVIAIESGKILQGKLHPRQKRLIEEWRHKYKAELFVAWKIVQNHKQPKRIKPLE